MGRVFATKDFLAGVLFILALAGLSKHETAKRGNIAGMVGMGLALVATLLLAARNASYDDGPPVAVVLAMILGAMLVVGAIGAWKARTVEMTGMPELIALLHSFVGLAAVLVGGALLMRRRVQARRPGTPPVSPDLAVRLLVLAQASSIVGALAKQLQARIEEASSPGGFRVDVTRATFSPRLLAAA